LRKRESCAAFRKNGVGSGSSASRLFLTGERKRDSGEEGKEDSPGTYHKEAALIREGRGKKREKKRIIPRD